MPALLKAITLNLFQTGILYISLVTVIQSLLKLIQKVLLPRLTNYHLLSVQIEPMLLRHLLPPRTAGYSFLGMEESMSLQVEMLLNGRTLHIRLTVVLLIILENGTTSGAQRP